MSNPDPKPRRRIIATREQWQQIADEKMGPCRICRRVESNGSVQDRIEFHHLVRRSQGGDDVPDNIVPLCTMCHRQIHDGNLSFGKMGQLLTESERRYVAEKRSQP